MYQYTDKDIDSHQAALADRYHLFQKTNPRVIDTADKILTAGPFKFFATQSFQYEIEDDYGRHVASTVWQRTHKLIFGKRWRRLGIPPMTGIAVMEKAQIFARSTRVFGTCHFHYLIHPHPLFCPYGHAVAIQLHDALSKAASSITNTKGWHLVSKKGTDVSLIESEWATLKYLAKEAWNPTWRWDERVFYLCGDGLL